MPVGIIKTQLDSFRLSKLYSSVIFFGRVTEELEHKMGEIMDL